MVKNIRGRVKDGMIEPMGELDLFDGQEVTVTIIMEGPPEGSPSKPPVSLRGIWKGVQISDELIEEATKVWEEGVKKQSQFLQGDKIQ